MVQWLELKRFFPQLQIHQEHQNLNPELTEGRLSERREIKVRIKRKKQSNRDKAEKE